MNNPNINERQVYYIPPNFLSSGTILNGSIKIRNAIETIFLVIVTSMPILKMHASMMVKIVILCIIAIPLGVFGVIGIEGDSLIQFAVKFLYFLKSRRKVYRSDAEDKDIEETKVKRKPKLKNERIKKSKREKKNKEKPVKEIRNTEKGFDENGKYRKKNISIENGKKKAKKIPKTKEIKPEKERPVKVKKDKRKNNNTDEIVVLKDIRNGIAETKDGRFIKILEIEPINFLLRSPMEQNHIIQSFAAYMKISPVKMQIKVMAKKADIGGHLRSIERNMENEENEKCIELQKDYYSLICSIGMKEAVTRRFFVIFEYEPAVLNRKEDYNEIVATLNTAAQTAAQYFARCGNNTIKHDNEDDFVADIFYGIYNRRTSLSKSLGQRINEFYFDERENPIDSIIAPVSADFTNGQYMCMDGLYYSYLYIPSDGYNTRVIAGWTSVFVNAGEGIDADLFFMREPKESTQSKLGRQIRINRSRIKDASDTNTEFDDIEGAIHSGYYLKQGMSEFEDFYYVSVLITVTADTPDNLEWRVAELKKLMVSQDMRLVNCSFAQEKAMNMALPVCMPDKRIFEKSKRNMLTSTAASLYPFTSYEMSDENGIMLGVNSHNNSLVIVDIFNSRVYKNANMAILGTSGAGKTFTMQLMALRMRRKGTQVFIIAPLKGHEFKRACLNVGGEFITISPASKQCINIMEIRKTDNANNELIDGDDFESSYLSRKIQQLLIFFSLLIPDMNFEEKQLLDEVLMKVYLEKGITTDNASLYNLEKEGEYKEMPLLGDVHKQLMANYQTKRMGNILNRLVNGSASTFNQHTNVDLSNPYTVLDISELSGDLLTVGMFLALDFVWDKAREDRTKEKAIFIDEIWQLMGASSNSMAAEFCLEIFKIIRGYGGAAIAATQDLNDFFALDNGKYGKGIINNAKTKIILNLEDDEAYRVQDTLKLTDAEISNIVRFERGNGLITTNANHISVKFKASQLEQELITTDRKDLEKIAERKKAEMSKGDEATLKEI